MKKVKGQDISFNEMPTSAFLIDATSNSLTHTDYNVVVKVKCV